MFVKLARILGMLCVAGAVAFSTVALAKKELSLANFIPPKHVMNAKVFYPFAKRVGEITKGEVTVKVYPSGELGAGPKRQYNRVTSGVADITFGVQGYTSSQFPRTLAAELPGLYKDPVTGIKTLWKNFDLVAGDYDRVKVLAVWYNSPMALLTRNKPVRSLADLKGLTIRAPSAIIAKALKAWGANAVTMPIPQVYNAMQTGVIDGVILGTDAVKSFRLQEVSKHATFGFPTAASTFFLLMNKKSWEGLSKAQQAAIDKISGEVLSVQATEAYQVPGRAARKAMEADAKYTVIDLKPSETKRLADMLAPVRKSVLDDLAKQKIDGKAIFSRLTK